METKEDGVQADMVTIETSGLGKHYRRADNRVVALEGIDLRVTGGEFIVLQGPSGSGKTTLLLTLGGLLSPDEGEIRIAGRRLTAMNAEQRARFRAGHVGFVFQQFHLVPYLDIIDNVTLPACAAPAAGDTRERAAAFLEELGLFARRHHTPAELSTGEKQRVALARAFINDPPVILADEPTGNLDRRNAEIVMEHLAAYAARGRTVLLATHDFRSQSRPSRILGLEAGRLVTDRSPGGEN